MTIPQWALLAFAVWTILVLFGTIGVYRWSRILTGRSSISEWRADVAQGSDWYRRAMRAHMNCVENLGVFGAIVFCATVAGADGRWQLRDARHTDVIAELRADSRVGARWLWLRWNAGSAWRPQPSMLLVHGDLPTADLRRLSVRLRLDACPQTAAELPVRDVF